MQSLGDRMKQYEKAYDIYMPSRLPVIVRVDGKGFSKFVKTIDAERPFDDTFSNAMANAMKGTAEKIEGCIFGYTQSDEITFVIKNDQSYESTPWFANRVQKIVSVISSNIAAHFNKNLMVGYQKELPLACFDARVFLVPDWQEAINTLIWRQNDCVKNSISIACYYETGSRLGKKITRKLMHGLNQKEQQELLFQKTGINWNDYPIRFKRGIGTYKVKYTVNVDGQEAERSKWLIDKEIPQFTQNREFLEKILAE